MTAEHKREIRQLWFIADHYLKTAKRNKNRLTNKDLSTTISNIAEIGQRFDQSKFGGSERTIMLLNAHLASCAMRLTTIDEILGRHYTSRRWKDYKDLISKGKKGTLKECDIENCLEVIAHCLLRHNTAHREKQPAGFNDWKSTMEKALQKVTTKELYKNMELVIESIKNDIAKILSAQTYADKY
jgi:hypothetical protein